MEFLFRKVISAAIFALAVFIFGAVCIGAFDNESYIVSFVCGVMVVFFGLACIGMLISKEDWLEVND
jgi:hypothetical protein